MELRTFEYFLAVVREQNISRAAEALYLTQPTLSRQMKELEEELGVTLFVRGRKLELTEAGVRLRDRAREMLELRSRIEAEMHEEGELSGVIRIGSGGQASLAILSEAIRTFHAEHPQVGFDFHTNSAEGLRDRLDHGLLDMALLIEPVDVSRYDYLRVRLKDRWGLLVRESDPLAAHQSITREDLLGRPLITTGRQALRGEINQWLGKDIDALDIMGTYSLVMNVVPLVRAGVASALTIDGAASLVMGDSLAFRPLEPELSMTSVLAWKRSNIPTRAVQCFLEVFKSIHTTYTSA